MEATYTITVIWVSSTGGLTSQKYEVNDRQTAMNLRSVFYSSTFDATNVMVVVTGPGGGLV